MNTDLETLSRSFEELIAHEVEDKAIPSISYVLVDRDRVLASGHVKRGDLSHGMDDTTTFRIGSLTKMFTALALMQLVERGQVDIDADITEYLPHFRPHNPFAGNPSGPHGTYLSLRKLMSHTAGLVREPKSGHYLDAERPSLSDTVDELAASTLKEDPSAGVFRYSNAGIAVVGRVVEKVADLNFTEYLDRHLLRPIGMTNSACAISPAIRARLAPAWMWSIEGDTPAPVFDLGGSPAGNIYSCLPDMARFARTLLRGGFAPDGSRIVSPGTLEEMWMPVGRRPAGYGSDLKRYGLGFGLGEVDGWKSVGHSGAVYGYATQMAILPSAGFGALIFSTLDFSNQIGGRLAAEGLRLVLAGYRMGSSSARAASRRLPVGDEQRVALCGRYVDKVSGEAVEVLAKTGRLYVMGDGVPLEIKRVSDTGFTVDGRIYGEGADYPHMDVVFPTKNAMRWKGCQWERDERPLEEKPVPSEIAPHIGEYGPDFNITRLFYAGGALKCLIEYFCTHLCEPVSPGKFKMHGLLYESEILELDAVDDAGRRGIRVGEMFLARRV